MQRERERKRGRKKGIRKEERKEGRREGREGRKNYVSSVHRFTPQIATTARTVRLKLRAWAIFYYFPRPIIKGLNSKQNSPMLPGMPGHTVPDYPIVPHHWPLQRLHFINTL